MSDKLIGDILDWTNMEHSSIWNDDIWFAVIAIMPDNKWISNNDLLYDCIGAVYFERNSPVASTSCSDGYLRLKCKRISESQAREIHPNLFTYLDYDPD